jgi:hypothetical protein
MRLAPIPEPVADLRGRRERGNEYRGEPNEETPWTARRGLADIEDAREELNTVGLPRLSEGPVTGATLRERLQPAGRRAAEDGA